MRPAILTINGGSSSVKFALFAVGSPLVRIMTGKFDRIGSVEAELSATTPDGGTPRRRRMPLPNHAACIPPLVQLVAEARVAVRAVGHRVVHGGPRLHAPQRVTPALIEACGREYRDVLQIACFDTAFHARLPRVAQLLAIPRRYAERDVRRYGFHGISYEYLLQELERIAGAEAAHGRVLLAHLGNGASMAAVRDGHCVDTTMAFTPAAGLVMGTRSGDIDPGLVAYLARTDGLSPDQFDHLVNAESGLLGLSETSSDVRDLLARAATDARAAEALAVFCHAAKKWLGALTAVLGGLDTLVFAGGIGEHAPPIRAGICAGLAEFGIELDAARNNAYAPVISSEASRVTVRVIPTDEERMIARATAALLDPHSS